jgi:type III protein arginine methyltransferase
LADTDLTSRFAAALETMRRQAAGDARKLAALAAGAHERRLDAQAYRLAREARAAAPGDRDIASLTAGAIAAGVPHWHFSLVRDLARNEAYDAAIRRAVKPGMKVLDIGAGTGLLAMMAARAGAAEVISCEMNPATADAAREIVALNGFSDRIRIVTKHSAQLDPEQDMGGRADLLVSEIIANDMVAEQALPAMVDAVARLLKPGAAMIPTRGWVRVALGVWPGLERRRMGMVSGFDCSPFNRLASPPDRRKVGEEGLVVTGPAADLFEFDFRTGGPYPPRRASVELTGSGGPANAILQWIRINLDEEGSIYENRPGPGALSCWDCLVYPLDEPIADAAGRSVRVHGAHGESTLRVWTD